MKSEHGSSGGSGKRTRNRHVTAKQHPRRDDAISSNDDTLFDNMAENPCKLVECVELLNGIGSDDALEDEDDNEDDGETMDAFGGQQSTVDKHVESLGRMGNDDGDDDSADEEVRQSDVNGIEVEEEDAYERIEEDDLPPLPAHNVPNCPQEDRHHFAKKKHVRNDKYSLTDMLAKHDEFELPSVLSAFKS